MWVLGSAFASFVTNEEIFFKGCLVLAVLLRTARDFINKWECRQQLRFLHKLWPPPIPSSVLHPGFTCPCSKKQRSRAIEARLAMDLHLLLCKAFPAAETVRMRACVCLCARTGLPFLQFLMGSKGGACTAAFLSAGPRIFLLSLAFYFCDICKNSDGI